MCSYHEQNLSSWLQSGRLIRTADAEKQGVSRMALSRLVKKGMLQRVARGLYMPLNMEWSFEFQLAVAAHLVPNGVVALLSALQFHRLTTETPHRVWMAVHQKAKITRQSVVPLKIAYYSGKAFTEGRETHLIHGIPVTVYTPAKTVVDCFKFRNKIGLDVALQALRECMQKKLCTFDEIWRYAGICRVEKIIQPYLESML